VTAKTWTKSDDDEEWTEDVAIDDSTAGLDQKADDMKDSAGPDRKKKDFNEGRPNE
jgi:hypothetical protein